MTRTATQTSKQTWFARSAATAAIACGLFATLTAAPDLSPATAAETAPASEMVTLTFSADAALAGQPAIITDNTGAAIAQTIVLPGLNVVTVPNTGAVSYVVTVAPYGPVLEARPNDLEDTGDAF